MPELTVIYWREIPAQVVATDGERTSRSELSDRFMKAIDAAAMRAGLTDSDAYLDEWRRLSRPCGDDLDQEVRSEAERLETAFDQDTLRRLARAGGTDGS